VVRIRAAREAETGSRWDTLVEISTHKKNRYWDARSFEQTSTIARAQNAVEPLGITFGVDEQSLQRWAVHHLRGVAGILVDLVD
jgi:hypothetical protein